ncbi:methyltransferase domain-containing protein [Nonomuraea sp. NPDC050556]|uniref:methyltransferase domain-containing protein n=1 Tax=Nonomuraea sp. NPDC050556 TaxID=3364369 RepID=UPI00379A296C
MQLLARTIRGIESLVGEEIRESGAVRRTRHREVWFDSPRLPHLRTADDVLRVVTVLPEVGAGRQALVRLARAVAAIDLDGVDASEGIDVSASFLGRRAYNRYDLEDAVGGALAGRLRVPYHSRRGGVAPPPGTRAWRLTVEGEEAVLALRPGERPAHRRPYKVGTVPGTLHPPLAAAMARLAGPVGTVLDPCCGAGTTLIEAHALNPRARYVGVDHRYEAVRVAAANGPGVAAWLTGDAGRLPLPGGSVDRVLVNPPWGRQVGAAGLLRADRGALWREIARVLAPGGRVVALLHEDEWHGMVVERSFAVSLAGLHPTLAVLRSRRSGA